MRKLLLDLIHLVPLLSFGAAATAVGALLAARALGLDIEAAAGGLPLAAIPLASCLPGLVALVGTSLLALFQVERTPLSPSARQGWRLVVLLSFGLLAPLHWFTLGRRGQVHPVRVRRRRRLRSAPMQAALTFPFAPGAAGHLAPTTWQPLTPKIPNP